MQNLRCQDWDGWVSGYNQQTVNLPLLAGYEGSNPSPSTRLSLELTRSVLRASRVVETAGQPHALFKSGLNFGVAAEGAKCAAVSIVAALRARKRTWPG